MPLPNGWQAGWLNGQNNLNQADSYWQGLGYDQPLRYFNGEEQVFDQPRVQDWLSQKNWSLGEMGENGGARRALFDNNGQIVPGSEYFMDYQDDQFGVAAILAAAGMGAMAYGAGAGLGAVPTEAATTGATSFPVSSSAGPMYSTPLEIGAGGAGGGAGLSDAALASGYDAGLTGVGTNAGANFAPVTTATATPVTQAASSLGTTGGPAGVGTGSYASNALTQLGNLFGGSGGYGNLAQLLASAYGIYQGNEMKDLAKGADPFGPYRAGYAQQLNNLTANPASVTSRPGYDAAMKAGELALTRNLAAQGLTGSGTAAQSLVDFGARFQNEQYDKELSQLANLAGAGSSGANGNMAGTAAAYNTINNSLENLIKIWGKQGG